MNVNNSPKMNLFDECITTRPKRAAPFVRLEPEGDFKRQQLAPSASPLAPLTRSNFEITTKKVQIQAAMVPPPSDYKSFGSSPPGSPARKIGRLLPPAQAPTPRGPKARSRLSRNENQRNSPTSFFDARASYYTFPDRVDQTPSELFRDVESYSTYKTPSGKTHHLICQRANKNCGPTAATMLLLDLIPQGKEGDLATYATSDYWQWLNSPLQNVENIALMMGKYSAVNALGYMPTAVRKEFESAAAVLGAVREKLTESGQPVILAIHHEKLQGHFITVDEYDKGFYYLRDPFSGHPYKVSKETLESVIEIEKHLKVSFLYLEKLAVNSPVQNLEE